MTNNDKAILTLAERLNSKWKTLHVDTATWRAIALSIASGDDPDLEKALAGVGVVRLKECRKKDRCEEANVICPKINLECHCFEEAVNDR